MVDVAAPGVNILSTAPGGHYLRVSGTSQAAPYVANVAARVKDENPNLKPAQIKEIILSTVDKKDYLKDKVLTAGTVNPKRAYRAAELSLRLSVKEAIKNALNEVADLPVSRSFEKEAGSSLEELYVLPLPSMIK